MVEGAGLGYARSGVDATVKRGQWARLGPHQPRQVRWPAGLLASMGIIGHGYDNSMIESFWSHIQVELPDQMKRNTTPEHANVTCKYLGIRHDRRRRDSQLGPLRSDGYQ